MKSCKVVLDILLIDDGHLPKHEKSENEPPYRRLMLDSMFVYRDMEERWRSF